MAIDYDSFRSDIGDTGDTSVFSELEIDTLFERATSRWSEDVAFEGARVLALNQLLANHAKFADYTANESSVKKSQVFKQVKEMRGIYASELDDVIVAAGTVSSAVRVNRRKARTKEYPDA